MIAVNQARCPVHSYHRDGAMRTDNNYGATPGYEPSSHNSWEEHKELREPPLPLSGAADRWDHYDNEQDHFTQPGNLFRNMTSQQQQVLFENTASALQGTPTAIKLRHLRHCLQADPAYGEGVANALKIPPQEVETS